MATSGLVRRALLVALVAVVCFGLYISALSRALAGSFLPLRRTAHGLGRRLGGVAPQPSARPPRSIIMTMATGDGAARSTVGLLQSLRDVNTTLPIVVALFTGGEGSGECHNLTLRAERGRATMADPVTGATRERTCYEDDALPVEIVSQRFLDAFAALGATVRVMHPIRLTNYTDKLPGGQRTK